VAAYELIRWPGFHPGYINVTGIKVLDRNDVLEKAAIDRQSNVWFLNREAARKRIETLPYAKTAAISVAPPAAVTIAVTERVPFVCVLAADGTRGLIDDERRLLEPDCGPKQDVIFHLRNLAQLPPAGTFIAAAPLAELVGARQTLEASGASYALYDVDEFGELVGVRSDGIVVKFGSFSDLPAKSRLVEPILTTVHNRLGSIKAVDVRTPATPVIEYR
jgi:hypothetical protein